MSKSKIRDMDGIIGKFNESKDKIGIVFISLKRPNLGSG